LRNGVKIVLMKEFDIKIFCYELINFDKYIEDYRDIVDLAIAKSLYLKDIKKIPKKFQHQNYENKIDFFKTLAPSAFVYNNLVSIRDASHANSCINYLNCGLLTFGYSTGIKDDIKILFINEDFMHHTGQVEVETFVPILKIINSESLKISEEIIKYYNTYNRFGVKLPAPDYGDTPEWFKDDIFGTTNVFINEENKGFLDMNIMEKNLKKGFSNKVKNTEPYLTEFRNYFDPKYKLVPNGDYDIYFHLVNFKEFPKIGQHCNFLNAHKTIIFKDKK
tara:strand:+ start:2034 stop:2864 length:831 start_codon:yes stop_codon:yes gene_type:complete